MGTPERALQERHGWPDGAGFSLDLTGSFDWPRASVAAPTTHPRVAMV